MDGRRVIEDVRQHLNEIAAELEEAAKSARGAADSLDDHDAAWGQSQQLFARLDKANHVVARLRHVIEDAANRGLRRQD